jgi:hypothetical protein
VLRDRSLRVVVVQEVSVEIGVEDKGVAWWQAREGAMVHGVRDWIQLDPGARAFKLVSFGSVSSNTFLCLSF